MPDDQQPTHIEQHVEGSENVTQIGQQIETMIQQAPKRERGCPRPPAPPAHFAGRTRELDDLRTRLAAGQQTALTAVQGLGGMGKTTLAQAFAKHATDRGDFCAVLWAGVTRNPDPVRLLTIWAQHADPDFHFPDAPLDAVAGHIRGLLTALVREECPCAADGDQRVLVVLDDVWLNGIKAARVLQAAAPEGATLLMTTRSKEVVAKLRYKALEINRLDDAEARDLLDKLIDHADATGDHRDRLVGLLDGHPLALELAARSVNLSLDGADIDDLLDGYADGLREGAAFDALELGEGEAAQKADSLTVTFQHSYEALDADLQARFRALGAFTPDTAYDDGLLAGLWYERAEDFDAEAAFKDTRRTIKALRNRGLLTAATQEGYGDGWYEAHPLLRSYARALLRQENELDAVWNRHVQFVTGLAAQTFKPRTQHEWGAITPYLPHIHGVGDALYDQAAAALGDLTPLVQPEARPPDAAAASPSADGILLPDDTRDLLTAAENFAAATTGYVFFRRETGAMGQRWLHMGLAAARRLHAAAEDDDDRQRHRRREGLFVGQLASWHDQRGQKQAAIAYNEALLPIVRELGDRRNEAATLNNLASIYDDLGDRQQALAYYEQALPVMREVGDRAGEAATLNNIGSIYWATGDQQQALIYYEQALPVMREVGDRAGEATTLNNIGEVYRVTGDNAQALAYYEQALPIRRAVGDRAGEAATLNNMAAVYFAQGDAEKALEMLEQVRQIMHAVGARAEEAMTCSNIAVVLHQRLNRTAEAIDYLEQAVTLMAQTQHPSLAENQQYLARLQAELRGEVPPEPAQPSQEEIIAQLVANPAMAAQVIAQMEADPETREVAAMLRALLDDLASGGE
jgi:tetratricopeptide (TPR) repeat protein